MRGIDSTNPELSTGTNSILLHHWIFAMEGFYKPLDFRLVTGREPFPDKFM